MWDEVSWQGNTYLRCQLLASWSHGFFTRQFTPQAPHDLVQVLDPAARVYRVKQVHGSTVLTPTAAEFRTVQPTPSLASSTVEAADVMVSASSFPPADGLVSSDANQAVWVCTADCTPVLIADRQTGQVAAVHAGWRGTAQKIVPQAIAQLQAQGSRLADLVVAMGPAIAGEVYQVSTDVARQVGQTVATSLDPIAELAELAEPPILPDPEPDRVRLDVRRINALQLTQLGLLAEQVAIAPHCTYQNPDRFFSYRRTRQKQVQWSGIVSRALANRAVA